MRIASIGAVLLSVAAICASGVLGATRHQQAETAARAALTSAAQQSSNSMFSYYASVRAELATTAGLPAIRALSTGERNSGALRAAEAAFQTLDGSLGTTPALAGIVSRSGQTVLLRENGTPVPPSAVPLPLVVHLSAAVEFGDMGSSEPFALAPNRRSLVAFTIPTNAEDNAFVFVALPVTALLWPLRAGQHGIALDLVQSTSGTVVISSTGDAVPPKPFQKLRHVMQTTQASGSAVSGQAMTAFVQPSLIGSALSGAVGTWVVTASNTHAVPSWLGSANGLVLGLLLGGALLLLLAAFGMRLSSGRLEALAGTDALTELPNRRRLLSDLERCLKASSKSDHVLVLLDLNGFKAFNDSFGHEAGDNLLRRVGRRLHEAARRHDATAYRLGGDEFCVLAARPSEAEVGSWAESALSESGSGFVINPSWGAVILPGEANNAAGALRLADERMYKQKARNRSSAGGQVTDVVLRLLEEREPGQEGFGLRVSELAEEVGRVLYMSDDSLEHLRRATLLHRVGLLAVPASILGKREPLTDDEREFLHGHPLVASRVLSGAPSLLREAEIIASIGEAFDGSGKPGELSGEAIPLEARVIAACATYVALLEPRPYRPAQSHLEAVTELRRCAGRQFDRAVVAALCEILDQRGSSRYDADLSRQPVAALL
jgi:diguanylate cyclase (GGDEF)-like protein